MLKKSISVPILLIKSQSSACLLPPNEMGRNQDVNPSLSDSKSCSLYPTLCCVESNAYFFLPMSALHSS